MAERGSYSLCARGHVHMVSGACSFRTCHAKGLRRTRDSLAGEKRICGQLHWLPGDRRPRQLSQLPAAAPGRLKRTAFQAWSFAPNRSWKNLCCKVPTLIVQGTLAEIRCSHIVLVMTLSRLRTMLLANSLTLRRYTVFPPAWWLQVLSMAFRPRWWARFARRELGSRRWTFGLLVFDRCGGLRHAEMEPQFSSGDWILSLGLGSEVPRMGEPHGRGSEGKGWQVRL